MRVHNPVVLTLIAAIALIAPQSQDIQAFRDSFAMRKAEFPSETADPAIVKCMDVMIFRLKAEVDSKTTPDQVETILNQYTKAIQAEETSSTEYGSVGASVSFGSGRVAIGVRMGAAARLRVFNAVSGQQIAVPRALDWSYQYDALPQFLPGGMLVVNGPTIQDAGVRYAYRVLFLKPNAGQFQLFRSIRGVWTLQEETESHLRINGLVASINTIDPPKAFFTDNATRLFHRNTIYELDQTPFRVRMTSFGASALRAVDEWMAQALKDSQTDVQKQFVAAYGRDPKMLESYSEKVMLPDSFEVSLKFDKTFVFVVQSKDMKETVKSMRIAEGIQ